MVALCSRCGHYIFILWFLLSSSQQSQIGCLPYFYTWCGLSANLGCRSETCCTRLDENTGRKISQNNSPSAHHLTICRAIFSQIMQISTIGKNLSSNISPTCSHNMVNFGPLATEIGSLVWGTPANFNVFRVLASLLQRRRST